MNSRIQLLGAALLGMIGVLASAPMSSPAAGRYPSVFIKGNERSIRKPLEISRISAETEIAGNIASTTLTMVFENPENAILEGELIFPIARGQTISRFAMDVNGSMREGVFVEKLRGRDIFESLVRWRIDPGLLEWVDGEHFRARVFPIPRKGTKTILVRYEQELNPGEEPGHFRYTLPLAFPWRVKEFAADVRIANVDAPLQQQTGFPVLDWEESEGGVRARLERQDYRPNTPLTIEVPVPEGPVSFVSKVEDDERYLYFRQTGIGHPPRVRSLAAAGRIGILWDISSSGLRRRFDLEFELLDRYFKERGTVEVSLVPFHNVVQPAQNFSVLNGDWSKLRSRMESFFLDGGTRYGALNLGRFDCDEFFLFTDGKGTFGDRDIRLGEAPVFPVSSIRGTGVHPYLHHVAAQSGGRVIDLAGRGVEAAFRDLHEMPYRFLGSADEILKEVYPPVADIAGTDSVAGVVAADADFLKLNFGYGKEVTETITLPLAEAGALHETDLAERLWVRKKLAELMGRQWQARKAIIDLGRDHGIVTPYTSLIVLDRVADYVNFRVEPPANEPELVAEWQRRSLNLSAGGDGLAAVHDRYVERKWWYQEKHAWLDETNLFLAQNGTRFLDEQIGLNPNDADLAADLRTILPLYGEAQKLKAAHDTLPEDRQGEAYRGWLTRALDLQKRIEPLRIKYADRYLAEQARKKTSEENLRRFLESLERQRKQRFSGGGDFFGAADPFAAPVSAGGGSAGGFGSPGGNGRSRPSTTPAPDGDSNAARPSTPFEAPVWTPVSKYTIRLQGAASGPELEQRYRVQKRAELANPLFYIDAADQFFGRGLAAEGIRVLSNVAELRLGDVQLMRMVAYRLQSNGQHRLAMEIFEEILDLSEDDPQSWRDLALASIENAQAQRGADLLWEVVSRTWPEHQGHVADVALNDLTNLIANPPEGVRIDTGSYDGYLLRMPMPVDLRVVMTWDAAQTDIDLFLYDPSNAIPRPGGEEITVTGCRLTGDNTLGFGPEEVLVPRALPGKYSIRAKLQARNSKRKNSPVTVYVEVTKNFGRPNAETKRFSRRITSGGGRVEIAVYHHVIDSAGPADPGR